MKLECIVRGEQVSEDFIRLDYKKILSCGRLCPVIDYLQAFELNETVSGV